MEKTKRIKTLFEQSLPFFVALGDPVRQQLLLSMINGEVLSVQELAGRTKLSRPTISHHLKILKDAHLIEEHKKGRQTFYQPQAGKHFYTVKTLLEEIDKVITTEGGKQ